MVHYLSMYAMMRLRAYLLRTFPQHWLHYELRPYHVQLLLFTVAFALSVLVLLTGFGLGTEAVWILAGGSVVFLEFFCSPALDSVQNPCGNILDTLPDWSWAIIHAVSNALVFYAILVILWLVLRAIRPIYGVEE